jgi:hypothetical protein
MQRISYPAYILIASYAKLCSVQLVEAHYMLVMKLDHLTLSMLNFNGFDAVQVGNHVDTL